MEKDDTIKVGRNLVRKVVKAIDAALSYEEATDGMRKLGITGEVGEILVCNQLGLELVLDARSEGFDAIDKDGLKVQIKTRRSESQELPRNVGRTSPFSKHRCDYALLAFLGRSYELREIWRAEYRKLVPIIERQKRRNPSLASFKSVAEKVYESGRGK